MITVRPAELSDAVSIWDTAEDLITFAVSPRHQRRGVGLRLLEAGEQWARAEGASGVRLVTGQNRVDARKFYAANGYEVRKEQTNLIKWWS